MLSNPTATRVAIGLSGGVDSAVSAALLVEKGYQVTGVYLECWNEPGCRNDQDRKDALQVALDLHIPFTVLDFKQTYKEKVLSYFLEEYKAGRTPNPDVLCNKIIKFGLFYEWAMDHGFDYVATGHYAQIQYAENQPQLATARDLHKDQTYFLYQIGGEKLSHVLFPIGHLYKTEVREEAAKRALSVAQKKDSTGICFIGEINVHEFLEKELGNNPGEVVDEAGNVLGTHQGLWFYTIGQRQGFTVNTKLLQKTALAPDKHAAPPLFVIGKNQAKNQLIVGLKQTTTKTTISLETLDLLYPNFDVSRVNNLFVRIRHTGELIPCHLRDQVLTLDHPATGVAAGQSAVLYTQTNQEGYVCLGGAIIER